CLIAACKLLCDMQKLNLVALCSNIMIKCTSSFRASTKENIVQKLFDWKKDGQKEVFLYDAGIHYNNGRPGQDEQFKGRVSHFQEQLKYGNASIIIRDIKIEDRGNYTCAFPRLKPEVKIFSNLLLWIPGILVGIVIGISLTVVAVKHCEMCQKYSNSYKGSNLLVSLCL
uniref:Ig-like domain-containing protein n=1 Tax=Lates calcarifer TaxID=8187 RepID=A0A4W6D2L7_LATCA